MKEKTEVPKSLSFNEKKLILSLCDHTGNWSCPYADDPVYEVVRIDWLDGQDVRLPPYIGRPVHGLLMAAPCTHFGVAGAESWNRKGDDAILEGLQVVDACLRAVAIYRPAWWALENPPGRLTDWLGPWAWTFQPHEFGGYLIDGEKSLACSLFRANDAYTKRTCIWGTAARPLPRPVPVRKPFANAPRRPGNRWNNACFKSHEAQRSITPLGFARAFMAVNP